MRSSATSAWIPFLFIHLFRMLLVSAFTLAIFFAFLGRYENLSTKAEIEAKWQHFWAPPFSKYYYTSEFLAASNFVGKAFVFAVLGFLLGNLRHSQRVQKQGKPLTWGLSVVAFVCIIATSVELLQIYLQPFVADASDILVFLTGAAMGSLTHKFIQMMGSQHQPSETRPG